jgi:hypothetical protein
MATIDKIKQALRIGSEDKIGFHNLISQEMVRGENDIYPNDEEFFNMFYANDPFGAVQRAVYGDYNPHHDYVMFDGYANFQSFDIDDLDKYLYSDQEIAEFLEKNPELIEDYGLEVEDEEPNEVSEEQYYDALEVLPPFYFDSVNGKKVKGGFAVGEPTTHTQTPDGMRATYSGYYKSGDKYFGLGQVYFEKADENGEPNGYGDDFRVAKTLDPNAFAKGGGVRRDFFTGREYSLGRNWTNDHRHENKSEDYEVPQAKRKRQYASGGGVRNVNGREYSFGRAWTNDHRHENEQENWEVPQADRVRKFAGGGAVELTEKQKKIDMNDNGRIDAEDFAILRKSMNGAWRNEHKHVNHSEKHEKSYARRKNPSRTGYKGRKEYGEGGSVDEKYKVVKTFRKSGRKEILEKNLTLEEAKRVVARHPNSNTSMVYFTRMFEAGGSTDYSEDYFDIGLFSVPNTDWRKHTDEEFSDMGRKIVKEKYDGDLDKAYNEVVRKKYSEGGKSELPHYKVDGKTFVDYNDAMAYCDKINCSYDKIIKTKEYKTGGTTPKDPVAFESSNLYFNSFGRDINGNSVIRVSFPNSRAFSIQLNQTGLQKTYKPFGNSGFEDIDETEINEYVRQYGSPAQKKKLKIYKK